MSFSSSDAKKIMATAVDMASEAGIAICCAIVDAGGYMILLERMDGGRFHTVHSCTTKAVCATSKRRPTTAKGAAGQDRVGSSATRPPTAISAQGKAKVGR